MIFGDEAKFLPDLVLPGAAQYHILRFAPNHSLARFLPDQP